MQTQMQTSSMNTVLLHIKHELILIEQLLNIDPRTFDKLLFLSFKSHNGIFFQFNMQ